MSITLDHSDFQCLQDQLVELKTKNYELADKYRRGQADFEAAKAKICSLQLKLEEQERDFQVTSSTLRRELEVVHTSQQEAAETTKEENEHYKTKYRVLLHKAKEIQQRYEKATEENLRLRNELEEKNKSLLEASSTTVEFKEQLSQIDIIKQERDNYEQQVKEITAKLDQQVEERKLQDKKGLQMVKELKRQLALEKNKSGTIQKRLESLLSSNGNNGSWNLVPADVGESNLSICSIELSDERDTTKHASTSVTTTTGETKSESDINSNNLDNSQLNDNPQNIDTSQEIITNVEMPLDEQAAFIERLTQMQHDKWMLEEKLSYLEQANISLSEELANKSDIIKSYFINQAQKTQTNHKQKQQNDDLPPFLVATGGSKRMSFPNNINQLLSDNSGLKKVVDFVKERSQQVASFETDTITREATKKMQLMLEETLIKCLKLQENLDFVTSELNKVKS